MHSKLILVPVIGALSLCLAGPAQAQERTEVAYGDLNLTTEAGRKQLDRRLHNAIRLVWGCIPLPYVTD
jgi:UrcA family protein